MFSFKRQQRILSVGGVSVGGQPGELPTVLIGSIFYERHGIVEDAKRGEFNEDEAEDLIKRQEELSDRTGNPCMVDVVAMHGVAVERYIDFVAGVTDAPILVDSSKPDVKIRGMEYAAHVGLLDRTVYNSVDYTSKEEEFSEMRRLGVKSVVVLAFRPRKVWPEGRLELLKGSGGERGLVDRVGEVGVENVLVDATVLDVPSIGLAARTIYLVKDELGLPTGSAPMNAILQWKRVKELGGSARDLCSAASAALTQAMGADFLIYGPIKYSDMVFPACATIDAMIAYSAKRYGIEPRSERHPLAVLPFVEKGDFKGSQS
jgi:tetrahydromethanopterin S-methyltransferase subunit H